MKKLIMIAIAIILVMSTIIPVMAAEEKFKTDLSVFKEKALTLSVYNRNIRENKKGERANCDCIVSCSCTRLYHILEDTPEDDFYSVFFDNQVVRPLGGIYQDQSSSMEETFCYEKSNIIKNLSPFLKEKDIEDVFKNKKTNLYGLLSSFNNKISFERIITIPREVPVIITDLWDTAESEEKELLRYEGEIVFCVPYASTNKEGVLHCEEVVNDLLWNHGWLPGGMAIYVIYTDEVIIEYSNSYHNLEEGFIKIYVP